MKPLVEVFIGAPDERDHGERVKKTHELDHVVASEELVLHELHREHDLFIIVPFEKASFLLRDALVDVSLYRTDAHRHVHLLL